MLTIEEPRQAKGFALWNLGFRPFFFGAGVWAVVAVALWTASFSFGMPPALAGLPALLWHGHEMVFGFALAVAAGFLLTAVKNWTGVQTVHGPALTGLVLLWMAARVMPLLPFPGAASLLLFAVADLGFGLLLMIAIAQPIVQVRQWKQLGLLSVIALLPVSNAVFFLGATGILPGGGLNGVLAGAYLMIVLVVLMAGRVLPIFVRNGVGAVAGVEAAVGVVSYRWVEIAAMPSLLLVLLGALFFAAAAWLPWVAAFATIVHAVRLYGWSVRGMWRLPLVWILPAAYAWLVIGLLLMALGDWVAGAGTVVLHALVYGGLGSMTIGMMSRVTIGHTGRMVNTEHSGLLPIYALLQLGAFIRVVLPPLDAAHYMTWVLGAQLLWILAFGLFVGRFAPLWWRPRTDGRYG